MASSSRPTVRLPVVDSEESIMKESGVLDDSRFYDVFLSHRGPDTKNNFVGFLHKELKSARLEAFFDVKGGIEKGDESWESIECAIKKTPIGLVIFSENFAGSKWCLKELHLMLATLSITVLPIFYKVKPSDLRHLEEGLLGPAFKKLCNYGCGEEELESWRADLRKSSTIGGWEIDDNSVQTDKVTEIVKKVYELSNKRIVRSVSGGHNKVGVKEVAEEIIKTLDEKKNIEMLGLLGMGGIGKTTLAMELYYRLSKRYASSCLVKDVTEKVRMADGVELVQKRILEGLCKGVDVGTFPDEEEGRRLLEGQLSKKSPFLLVLDDVSTEKDMMEYIMTPEMLMGGSMCIVTTRDQGVLEEFQARLGDRVYAHAMCLLSDEDSQRVFTSYAFGGDCKVEPKFEALVEGMSKACGGVPLVLKVIGSCLKGNDVNAWEEMKERLEENGDVLMEYDAIYNRLRRSYDTLSPFQKEMFLDIACALIGESADWARRVWKSLKWCPAINFPILEGRALVSIDDEGRFVMHDVLRDMGRSIEMRKNSGERARMWMPESLAKLEEEALSKDLHCLVINRATRRSQTLDVSHMKELRIFLFNGSLNVIAIPANLRWFSIQRYGIIRERSLPEIPQNNKLVILGFPDLKACPISCNQGHNAPCSALGLGGLTALECLDLSWCKMDELPNLEQLCKMEEFNIVRSKTKVVPGLGCLSALVKFNASACGDLIELPNIGKLTKLRKLTLCYATTTIPGLGERMPTLTDLSIHVKVLETIGVLCIRELQTLQVWKWSESRLAFGINWARLKRISIIQSKDKKLDGLLEMKNLEHLSLEHCHYEYVLCLNHLTTLRSITIYDCGQLKQLPDLLGLTRLETLKITYCWNLSDWTLLSRPRMLSETPLPSLHTLTFDGVEVEELQEKVELLFPQFTFEEVHNKRHLTLYNGGVWKRLKLHGVV